MKKEEPEEVSVHLQTKRLRNWPEGGDEVDGYTRETEETSNNKALFLLYPYLLLAS